MSLQKYTRLKYLVSINTEHAESNEGYVGLENVESWSGRKIETNTPEAEGVALSYQKGDVLFGKLRPYLAKCYVAEEDACCSMEFLVMRPKKVVSKYLQYRILSAEFIDKVNMSTYGAKMPRANWSFIGNLKLDVPSMEEQQLIANYLDDRCSKIDAIIAEAKASIEEYKELKQAVIYEAVTKGIDENATTYNTNNIWIPSLPENVPLSRLGLHYDVILGKMLCPKPRNEEDTLEPYICAANVHFDGVSGELKSMWFNDAEKSLYAVHCKDMLIVEGGAGAGGAAIVEEEPSTGTYIQNSIMIVRAKDCEDNRYARYLVEALVNRNYVDYVCNKATIPHFTKEKVSTIPYPVFSVEERIRISDYLDIKTKQMDALISEKQSLIEDIEAYKKSLIYEVVTGKRKVVA